MAKITALPGRGDQNEVRQRLQNALEQEYDEVFIIGTKDGLLHTTHSGYKDIERKLGALELLKHNLIDGGAE